jgi:hypothetical protein
MSQTLLLVAGAIVALVVLAAFVLILSKRQAAVRWVESLFRRPPRKPRQPGSDHYYKPYWS